MLEYLSIDENLITKAMEKGKHNFFLEVLGHTALAIAHRLIQIRATK